LAPHRVELIALFNILLRKILLRMASSSTRPSVLNSENKRVMENVEEKLDKLFKAKKMPESHGLNHCKIVLGNMEAAIQDAEMKASAALDLSENNKLTLSLAAVLHEADDHKYFGADSNNAETILKEALEGVAASCVITARVLEMINLVSASVNGNTVPEKAREDPTLLWPRFCDRLEAIGTVGAVRCLQYNQEKGDPLTTEQSPRPKSEDEVWSYVTEERWNKYQNGGSSASMMDHYYDKLLQIAVFPPAVVQNDHLVQTAQKRVEPLVRICLEYGRTGKAPVDLINSFKKD